MLVEEPAATCPVGLPPPSLSTNSAEWPVHVKLVMFSTAVPELVTVMYWVLLVRPTATVPRLLGELSTMAISGAVGIEPAMVAHPSAFMPSTDPARSALSEPVRARSIDVGGLSASAGVTQFPPVL